MIRLPLESVRDICRYFRSVIFLSFYIIYSKYNFIGLQSRVRLLSRPLYDIFIKPHESYIVAVVLDVLSGFML